jgi:hypothetical protein
MQRVPSGPARCMNGDRRTFKMGVLVYAVSQPGCGLQSRRRIAGLTARAPFTPCSSARNAHTCTELVTCDWQGDLEVVN